MRVRLTRKNAQHVFDQAFPVPPDQPIPLQEGLINHRHQFEELINKAFEVTTELEWDFGINQGETFHPYLDRAERQQLEKAMAALKEASSLFFAFRQHLRGEL